MECRVFSPDRQSDIAEIQKVIEAAPAASMLMKGRLPLPSDAEEFVLDCPPGKSTADKLLGGFYSENEIIGCFEMCQGYPEPQIAYLGFLLIAEEYQGQGFGREAVSYLRELLSCKGFSELRLAVLEQNKRAIAFWKREGFEELYSSDAPGGYVGKALVMQTELLKQSS